MFNGSVPKMTFGRYAGVALDKLPSSYLRWLIGQNNIPDAWLRIIKQKLKGSDYESIYLNVSRHAIDMYSKRFLDRWIDRTIGIATHITREAERAWKEGIDKSKHRHQDDGIVKELDGVKFVFKVSESAKDYKELITIMD